VLHLYLEENNDHSIELEKGQQQQPINQKQQAEIEELKRLVKQLLEKK